MYSKVRPVLVKGLPGWALSGELTIYNNFKIFGITNKYFRTIKKNRTDNF